MPIVDNDALIRDRAYEIWERAGQPLGREHEHWARARVEIEREQASRSAGNLVPAIVAAPVLDIAPPEPVEAKRMRQALYCPEPFSFELFGTECLRIDLPIVLRQGADRQTPVAA